MLSLMDGFLGYNQIWVAPQDQHKMAFTTPWGTFCYKVMPFGLKNVDATYQHAMTYVFHDMMHDVVKDYVDDLLSKSKTHEQHWDVLERVFACLLKHNVRLNPKKCVFGITSGKLLGFIISKRGIEVDPKKVIAITSMPPPHDLKTLRSLQGKIQVIHCFITQLSDRCHPFNDLLKKGVHFDWGDECQKAFEDLKQCLLNPPILIPPKVRVPFYLYLSAIDLALGVMLAQKNQQAKEQAIYYLSRTLIDYEIRYIYMEKVYLTMVFTTKKL